MGYTEKDTKMIIENMGMIMENMSIIQNNLEILRRVVEKREGKRINEIIEEMKKGDQNGERPNRTKPRIAEE